MDLSILRQHLMNLNYSYPHFSAALTPPFSEVASQIGSSTTSQQNIFKPGKNFPPLLKDTFSQIVARPVEQPSFPFPMIFPPEYYYRKFPSFLSNLSLFSNMRESQIKVLK